MNRSIPYLSWFALALALLAWAGVVYGDFWIQKTAKERGANALNADQMAAQSAYASRLKALVQETKVERGNLENISHADLVSVANAIEAAGKSAGVSAKVSTAIPSGNAIEIPGGSSLQGLAFIVQAEGSFAGLMQLVRVLEKFPGFSTVEQFDFERVPSLERSAQPWRTTLRMKILTTSEVSS